MRTHQIPAIDPYTGVNTPAGGALLADGSGHFVSSETSTGAFLLPSGTTAQRPVPTATQRAVRFNTDTNVTERWNGTAWVSDTSASPADTPVRWRLTDTYVAGQIVVRGGQHYMARNAVPANTNFSIGAVASPFMPVLQDLNYTWWEAFVPGQTYSLGDVVCDASFDLYQARATGSSLSITDRELWQPYVYGLNTSLTALMAGADGTHAGMRGLVPAPAATDNIKFLKGDGTWALSPGMQPWELATAYAPGSRALNHGLLVEANAAVPANTAFAWGTAGATWKPVITASPYRGLYSSATPYVAGDIVSALNGSGHLYVAVQPSMAMPLATPSYWLPYSDTHSVDDVIAAASVDFVGSTNATDGVSGDVPQPLIADKDKFLKGDGTWAVVPAAGIQEWLLTDAVAAGTSRLHNGHIVVANGAIAANTAFAWGTTGATWKPLLPASDPFVGLYAVATAYSSGDVVAESNGNGRLFVSVGGSTGIALTDDSTWVPYSISADLVHLLAVTQAPMDGATLLLDGKGGDVPTPVAGEHAKFLRGDGTWAAEAVLVGATAAVPGIKGLVPAPLPADQARFLRGDGTWADLASSGGLVYYDPTETYLSGQHIWQGGYVYRANGPVPASTPFSIGNTAGTATWALVVPLGMTFLSGYTAGTTYVVGDVVRGVDLNYYTCSLGPVSGVEASAHNRTNWTRFVQGVDADITSPFLGSDGSFAGRPGLVPLPQVADQFKFLRGDGAWSNPTKPVLHELTITSSGLASFTLPRPLTALEVEQTVVEVNGLVYRYTSSGTHWTISGSLFEWWDADYPLQKFDKVLVIYPE